MSSVTPESYQSTWRPADSMVKKTHVITIFTMSYETYIEPW